MLRVDEYVMESAIDFIQARYEAVRPIDLPSHRPELEIEVIPTLNIEVSSYFKNILYKILSLTLN